MIWVEVLSWVHCKKIDFHYCLISMQSRNFLEFIYFNLLEISVNFSDQLVTVICNPVLKD